MAISRPWRVILNHPERLGDSICFNFLEVVFALKKYCCNWSANWLTAQQLKHEHLNWRLLGIKLLKVCFCGFDDSLWGCFDYPWSMNSFSVQILFSKPSESTLLSVGVTRSLLQLLNSWGESLAQRGTHCAYCGTPNPAAMNVGEKMRIFVHSGCVEHLLLSFWLVGEKTLLAPNFRPS